MTTIKRAAGKNFMLRCIRSTIFALTFATLIPAFSAPDVYAPDYAALQSLTRERLEEMSLDDPILYNAYAEAFILTFDRSDGPYPWLDAIKEDIVRRGDSATPLLVKIFHAHPFQVFRENLFFKIEWYPTIQTEPYLALAREYWFANKFRTPNRTCYAIAHLLSRQGSASDLAILKEMLGHPSGEIGLVIRPQIETHGEAAEWNAKAIGMDPSVGAATPGI
jgi:hypothetical protein